MPSSSLRLQTSGTTPFPVSTVVLYAVPSGQTLYLSSFSVTMRAAIAAGGFVHVEADSVILGTLSAILGTLSLTFDNRPILAGTNIQLVGSAAAVGTADWGLQGDLI